MDRPRMCGAGRQLQEPKLTIAPTREYTVATVHSSQVKSSDESSVLVEGGGLEPTRWFLEQSTRHESDVEEPPKKRRKTEEISESADDRISLSEVNIDFHFPETIISKPASQAAIEADVDFSETPELSVVPYGVELDSAGTKLRLGLPSSRGPVLFLNCSKISETALNRLLDLARPVHLESATSNDRLTDHPATRLSCTLTRSVGQLYTVVRLKASLSWQSGISAFPAGAPTGRAKLYADYDLLLQAFPDEERATFDHAVPFKPSEFYNSVHVPSKDIDTSEMYHHALRSDLYPFQKRAVSWLLAREGMRVSEAGELTPIHSASDSPHTSNWLEKSRQDCNGNICYVNHLQGVISRKPNIKQLSGGILAEEMGLGKTVELLALISLHRRTEVSYDPVPDPQSGTLVSQSRATFIVTPASLTDQWSSELHRHAPHLSVYHYPGMAIGQKAKKGSASDQEVIRQLCEDYDVVITTYNVLTREVHFAQDPPDRAMRHARRFERKRSPLVEVQWWRVCLDEAQLVESGVTAAARVARRLPRVHSWAVTGTPLKKDIQDLLGLLVFLDYRPFSENGKLWGHLITNHRHLFPRIFGEIALRHTKAQIRDELRLPPQKRVVVTVPFSVVEQQNYSSLFEQMCKDVGLNLNGEPITDDFDPTDPAHAEAMRTWLVRLRQTCLHPQVGGRNRKALGRGKQPLRTVAEVLEVMIEQNESSLRTEERALIAAWLQRAHIHGNNREDEHRAEKAVEIYAAALSASELMVKDARETLKVAVTANPDLGKAAEVDGEDSAEASLPLLVRLRNNLRIALQLQHQCAFYNATAYFQIKSNEALTRQESEQFEQLEEKEAGLYEIAKSTRKELLRDTHRKAERYMHMVKEMASQKFCLPKIKDLKSLGGIESRRIVEKSDELFDVIRDQEGTLKRWRAKMADYLLKPLVDEDEGVETTGDEYEESTKLQDELYVYFDAFKTLLADLTAFVTGEGVPLTDHEAKVVIGRAKWVLDPEYPEDQKPQDVHAPELTLELFAVHEKSKRLRARVGSVRGLIQETRELESAMQWTNAGSRTAAEQGIAQQYMRALQEVLTAYTKALASLEKDLELFRSTQNQRVEFYRQLQELSDDVTPYKDELDDSLDRDALAIALDKEEQVSKEVAQLKTKNRFLLHLRDDNAGQSGPKTCIICTSNFERGVLTVCGHQFCKDCLSHWFAQSRSCPMCKRRINLSQDIHDITFNPRDIRAQEESQDPAPSEAKVDGITPIKSSLYTEIGSGVMEEVKAIDLPASYGSKIDTLGRHLHWIREHDPGAKSIVFSQYREFLDVLGTALKDFKLGYARLGRQGAVEKFRNDASIDCLLLDAKTDSSGLTLTNATHVFLCEPLIQTAVELQAIARVHRIGQTRPTTVWMYLINDTVEGSIYEISVARRLAHVQSRQQQTRREEKSRSGTPAPQLQEVAIEAANSEELQSAPLTKLLVAGKGGGELVQSDDLWQCLFGKSKRVQANAAAEQEVSRHLRASAAEDRAARAGAQDERG